MNNLTFIIPLFSFSKNQLENFIASFKEEIGNFDFLFVYSSSDLEEEKKIKDISKKFAHKSNFAFLNLQKKENYVSKVSKSIAKVTTQYFQILKKHDLFDLKNLIKVNKILNKKYYEMIIISDEEKNQNIKLGKLLLNNKIMELKNEANFIIDFENCNFVMQTDMAKKISYNKNIDETFNNDYLVQEWLSNSSKVGWIKCDWLINKMIKKDQEMDKFLKQIKNIDVHYKLLIEISNLTIAKSKINVWYFEYIYRRHISAMLYLKNANEVNNWIFKFENSKQMKDVIKSKFWTKTIYYKKTNGNFLNWVKNF